MITTIKYLALAPLFLLCSCKSGNASGHDNETPKDTLTTFTLPAIPVMLTSPEQRADFLVKHYWDNVNFADTNHIHHQEIMEQTWADYCDILNHVPLPTAQAAIKETIGKAAVEKKVFNHITELADKYLYDPNSPMRKEEFYIPVLEAMVASPILSETEKIRPQARLKLAQKNRINTKALDFTYTLSSGAQSTLYKLSAPYTLLFINNPGCHACGEMIEALKKAPTISQLIASKKLKVLSLYAGEDLAEWKKYRGEFPAEWINGYDKDQTVETEERYDLRAIPTLYLLNSDKKVLLKDATEPAIEEYLKLNVAQ